LGNKDAKTEPAKGQRIVMKFGGTSMAGTERIRRVANIVRAQAAGGNEVAVVVSAMPTLCMTRRNMMWLSPAGSR